MGNERADFTALLVLSLPQILTWLGKNENEPLKMHRCKSRPKKTSWEVVGARLMSDKYNVLMCC